MLQAASLAEIVRNTISGKAQDGPMVGSMAGTVAYLGNNITCGAALV